MKKTKIISLLLSLTLLVGVANPAALAIEARAADGTTSGSGMEISKTAVYNAATDAYTITLEAYATGSKVISTEKKDIPTDIVLVLDQSGSMGIKITIPSIHTRKLQMYLTIEKLPIM